MSDWRYNPGAGSIKRGLASLVAPAGCGVLVTKRGPRLVRLQEVTGETEQRNQEHMAKRPGPARAAGRAAEGIRAA